MRARAEKTRRRRHRVLVVVGLLLLVTAFATVELYVQQSPTALAPVNTVTLHSITVLNILLLLVLLFVLGRNLIKLYVERRRQKLGSRFRTKVVVTYIGMALVPCVLLFLAASNLIKQSVDRWFSTTTTEIVERARELARQSRLDQEDQLLTVARELSDMMGGYMPAGDAGQGSLFRDTWQLLRRDLELRRRRLLLDAISVYEGGTLVIDPLVDAAGPLAGSPVGATLFGRSSSPEAAPAATDGSSAAGTDGDGADGSDAGGGAAGGRGVDVGAPGGGNATVASGPAGDGTIGAPIAGAGAADGAAAAGRAPGPTAPQAAASGTAGPGGESAGAAPVAGPLQIPEAHLSLVLDSAQPVRLATDLADGTSLLQIGVPIRRAGSDAVVGVLVAHRRVPVGLLREADAIDALYRSYDQGFEGKEQISTAYQLTFVLMTLLILFSALWVGLYLARGVTVPIQKLAEGTRAVASGDLDYQVEVEARDELGILVASFNQMTRDLHAGQEKLQQSRDTLQQANTELEERRSYMEAVLANIATGVISMNADGRVTTFNRAAERMLGMEAGKSFGRPYREVLGSDTFGELRQLMDRAKARRSPLEEELEIEAAGNRRTIAAHCSSLRDSAGAYLGTVVVIDDLTELIKAQKTAAWREVARRIAHEIRNPLTPIQLSAQRIARRYRRAAGAEGQYDIIEEGTRTILQEVDTLKGLVSEFSRYARMPSVNPVPTSLHEILEAGLLSCASMHDGISVTRRFCAEVPAIKADPEQLKRAFSNLFDNAIEAMQGRGTLTVSTSFDAEVEMVRIEVADSGPGIRPDDKARLFLPYFSRKRDGTGLGLAIVHQIVSDHRGYVRVADNRPHGSVFVVELPR